MQFNKCSKSIILYVIEESYRVQVDESDFDFLEKNWINLRQIVNCSTQIGQVVQLLTLKTWHFTNFLLQNLNFVVEFCFLVRFWCSSPITASVARIKRTCCAELRKREHNGLKLAVINTTYLDNWRHFSYQSATNFFLMRVLLVLYRAFCHSFQLLVKLSGYLQKSNVHPILA